ncbi:MAG: peroxiredoxin [Moraxellaceae bacterium]|jgi:peroxiredoxin Q/BCP|nr:peroxiredoxin [Moraxellaceae bacterium]
MPLAIGDAVPDFRLPATSNKEVLLSALRGWHVVLYFYPKDSTPGCTLEGQQFRDLFEDFKAARCMILGVSRDSLKAHENFKEKQCFPFELISDSNEELCQLFDVIKMKNMYGKQVQGIERSTFLIDQDGVLRGEWRKVKVEGHAQAVLEAVRQLKA